MHQDRGQTSAAAPEVVGRQQPDRQVEELLAVVTADVAALTDRLRRVAPVWWRVADPTGATRADTAYHLATRLVQVTRELTGQSGPALPRLGDAVLPDQLAVVAYDLQLAAQGHPPAPRVLAIAVAEVLLHWVDLGGRAPAARAATLVATVLEVDPADLAAHSRRWCTTTEAR